MELKLNLSKMECRRFLWLQTYDNFMGGFSHS